MLSSSEDKAIDLLQLLPTLSKTYPPLSCFIYPHIFPTSLRVVENIGVVDNSLLLKYITNIDATLWLLYLRIDRLSLSHD